MEINRCVCMNRTFAALRQEAIDRGIDGAQKLMQETGCGRQCGRCGPYIHVMMQAGRTTFDRILPERIDQKAG